MFNLKSLPVAPEFVDALQETAVATVWKAMEAADIPPKDIFELFKNIINLDYYPIESYRAPKNLIGEPQDRFEIEKFVIETINQIGNLGGEFHGTYTFTYPRKDTVLQKIKMAKEE